MLKDECAALDRRQASHAADLLQLDERLAAAAACNLHLQKDLAAFSGQTHFSISRPVVQAQPRIPPEQG